MSQWEKGKPRPELFAAYADGELERDPALWPFRQEVEHWLAEHPEDLDQVHGNRPLEELWDETSPAEPAPGSWAVVLERLQSLPLETSRRRGLRWGALVAALGTMAAAVLLVAFLWPEPLWPEPRPQQIGLAAKVDNPPAVVPSPLEIYLVASSAEIEILSVEGADTHSLVVGQMPVQGPLELLAPGEVTVTSVQPAASDNMFPDVRLKGPATPMIWARVDTEP